MGWNGIGIGWPNASAGAIPEPNISLLVRPSTDFDILENVGFSDADFTIEWFQKMTNDSGNPRVWSFGSFPNAAHAVSIDEGAMYYWINGVVVYSTPVYSYLGAWVTFCVMRKADRIYIFLNGIQLGYTTNPSAIPSNGLPLYIGSEGNNSLFNGRMSNFRFTNGTALYDPLFPYTPATTPLPNTAYTKLLTLQGDSLALELTDNSGASKVLVNGTGIYDGANPFTGYQGSIQFGTVV